MRKKAKRATEKKTTEEFEERKDDTGHSKVLTTSFNEPKDV